MRWLILVVIIYTYSQTRCDWLPWWTSYHDSDCENHYTIFSVWPAFSGIWPVLCSGYVVNCQFEVGYIYFLILPCFTRQCSTVSCGSVYSVRTQSELNATYYLWNVLTYFILCYYYTYYISNISNRLKSYFQYAFWQSVMFNISAQWCNVYEFFYLP